MPLFFHKNSKLTPIREKAFSLEKEMQQLTEQNLEVIFGLQFVGTEVPVHGLFIDTLAFDLEKNAFVIIEYKRDKSFSVVDQGFSYLSLMLNNKADFILEYNEKKGGNLKREDVDWSQARILFLARSFTTHQQNAINFKDLPIELWEVARYDNDSMLYNRLRTDGATESIRGIGKSEEFKAVSREIKEYTEDDLVPKGTNAEKLFQLLKEKISVIDPELKTKATKFYIAFHLPNDWRNIFSVWFRQNKLLVDFNRSRPEDFKDPEKKLFYREKSLEHYNQHISRMEVKDERDVEYAVYLLGQLYNRFQKEGEQGST